jgi:hypothetical protein
VVLGEETAALSNCPEKGHDAEPLQGRT